jgi:hypothetical protein
MPKSVPNATTSERALLIAMIESGRRVSLAMLGKWREQGLLPPFASSRLGQGKGKGYFWREPTIFPQAAFAYDIIRAGKADFLPICLWVAGFPVSTHLFRRAWLHNARNRKPWSSKPPAEMALSATSDKKPIRVMEADLMDGISYCKLYWSASNPLNPPGPLKKSMRSERYLRDCHYCRLPSASQIGFLSSMFPLFGWFGTPSSRAIWSPRQLKMNWLTLSISCHQL